MPLPLTTANSPQVGDSCPPSCSPSSDADYACHCLDQLASECRLNPTAYQREGKEKIRKLELERNTALKSLAELHAALVRYEGDVDGEAPSEHRRMMERAAALLPENDQVEARRDKTPPQ